MTDSPTTLKLLVEWTINLGAMRFAVWLVDVLKVPEWPYDLKTYFGIFVAVVVGLAAWGVGLFMGYLPLPVPDSRQWIEGAAGVALTIIVGSQVWYGALKARRV